MNVDYINVTEDKLYTLELIWENKQAVPKNPTPAASAQTVTLYHYTSEKFDTEFYRYSCWTNVKTDDLFLLNAVTGVMSDNWKWRAEYTLNLNDVDSYLSVAKRPAKKPIKVHADFPLLEFRFSNPIPQSRIIWSPLET